MTSEAAKIRVIAHEAWKSNPVLRSAALCANGEATGVIETGYGDELKGLREEVAAIEKEMKALDERSAAIREEAEGKFEVATVELRRSLELITKKYAAELGPIEAGMSQAGAKLRQIMTPFREEINAVQQQLRADVREKTKDVEAQLGVLRKQRQDRLITSDAYVEAARPLLAQIDALEQPLQREAVAKNAEIRARANEAVVSSGVRQELQKLEQEYAVVRERIRVESAPIDEQIRAIADAALKALDEKLDPHLEQREKTVRALVATERKVDDLITKSEDRAVAALEQLCLPKVAAKPAPELAPEVRAVTLYSELESEGAKRSYSGELLCKAEGSEAIPVSADTNNLLERLGALVPMAVKDCAAAAKQR